MSAKPLSIATERIPEIHPVRFEFLHLTAAKVCIAGSFNGWNPVAMPMSPAGNGAWLRALWLPSGTHEYLFVVDGAWVFDPNATDYVPNVFGGMNSVLEVLGEYPSRRRFAESPSLGCRTAKKGKPLTRMSRVLRLSQA